MNSVNIKVSPMEISWGGSALGFTDGDIEFASEEQVVDVTAHQYGTSLLTSIRTGVALEFSIAIKETSIENIRMVLGQAGTLGQASGASGSEPVIGWGTAKSFTSVLPEAKKLVLHPVSKAADDRSEDIACWKAYPVLESWTFSGENPNIINVTFKCYPDQTKSREVELFVVGDHLDGDYEDFVPEA